VSIVGCGDDNEMLSYVSRSINEGYLVMQTRDMICELEPTLSGADHINEERSY
jgi:hypothetical protein